MDEWAKACESLRNLAQSVSLTSDIVNGFDKAKYDMLKSTLMYVKKEKDMDGFVGTYRGHDIYYCNPKSYFEKRKEYDDADCCWWMTDTNVLVHRGKVIGKVVVNSVGKKVVSDLEQVNVIEYYPQYKESTPARMGNPTAGTVKVVTERKTVEEYMQHTIDVLNEGVLYGQRALSSVKK